MNTGDGNQPSDLVIDFSPYPAPKLEPSASPPAYVDSAHDSQTSSNESSPSNSQPLPTAGPNVDPNREQVKSKWTPEDEAEVLEWTPLYLKAGKSFEDIAQALTKKRSTAAVRARWNKLAEGKEEFAHLVAKRKRSRTTTEEASDRASSSTPAPAHEQARAKAEPIEVGVQGDMRTVPSYTGYGYQAAERLPTPAPWDIDEDPRLTSTVLLRGEEDWERVRQEMQPSTRTAQELRERWFTATKSVDEAIRKRGLWNYPLPQLQAALAATPGFDHQGHLFLDSNKKWTPTPPYFSSPATDAIHQRTAHQAQLIAREAASTPDPRISRPPSNVEASIAASLDAHNISRVPGYDQTLNNIAESTQPQPQQQPQQQPQRPPSSAPSLPAAEDRAQALVAAHAAAHLQVRSHCGVGGGAIPPFINKPSPLATSTILSANGIGQGWGGGGVPSMGVGDGAGSSSSTGSASAEAHEARTLGSLPPLSRSEPAPRRFELPPPPGSQPSSFKLPLITSVAANTPSATASTPSTPVHFQPRPLPISFPHQQGLSAQTPTTQAPSFHLHQQPTSPEEVQRQLLRRVSGAVTGGSTPASAPPSLQRKPSYNYDMFNTPIAPVNPLYTLPRTQSTPALSFYSQSTSNGDAIASQRLPQSWTSAPIQSYHQPYSNLPPLPTLPGAAAPQLYAQPVTPPIVASSTAERKTKDPTPPSTPRARSNRAASQKAGELMQKLVKESQEDDDEEHEEWVARDAAKFKAGQAATASEKGREKDIPTTEDEPKGQKADSEDDGSDEEWDGEDFSAGGRRGGGKKKGSTASKSVAAPAKKRARTMSESSLSSAIETDEARTPAEGEKLGGVGEEEEEEIDVEDEGEKMFKNPKLDSPKKEPAFSMVVDVAQKKPRSSSQESA